MSFARSLSERAERDVYVASTWTRGVYFAEDPPAGKLRTVKRPEGRAPAHLEIAVAYPDCFWRTGRPLHIDWCALVERAEF